MRQISFEFSNNYKREFGGSLIIGKRKNKRPISTKHPLHIVLKASEKKLFKPHNSSLENLIRAQAKKFNIQLYELALNWSHIHLLVRIYERKDYIQFIRSLTSILVQKIKAVRPELNKIFNLRPFTRIISWGRDFKNALNYQILNQLESFGLIKRKKKSIPKKPERRKQAQPLFPDFHPGNTVTTLITTAGFPFLHINGARQISAHRFFQGFSPMAMDDFHTVFFSGKSVIQCNF
jgi:REP element-mobilizing transposase RayT